MRDVIAFILGNFTLTFFVAGLQYSVVSFLPFLALMSIVYARTRPSPPHA